MSQNNENRMIIEEQNEKLVDPIYNAKIEKYKTIASKLKELIIITKGSQKLSEDKTNILEYIKIPEIFPFEKLKNDIYDIFNIKSNKELYAYILNEINELYSNEKFNKNTNEANEVRIQFYKTFEQLNYFITPTLLTIDIDNKEKSFDYYKKYIIKDNIVDKDILRLYINIFELYSLLKDYYSIIRQSVLSIEGPKLILNLIEILNLQSIYPFKFILKKKKEFFININNFIYKLYQAYSTSLNELNELSNYLLQFKKNKLSSEIISKILNDNKIKNQIDNSFKVFLIENLMINYSVQENANKIEDKEILLYYSIVINNIELLSKDYQINFNILNDIINKSIKEKEYDKTINFLLKIKDSENIDKYINKEIIENLFKSLPFEKTIAIIKFIKNNKELIKYLLKTNIEKNAIKLIKALNLKENEYDNKYDETCITNFFYYKINTCFDDYFDILFDFALINSNTFNTCIKLLLKNLKKGMSNDMNQSTENNEDTLPLNEDEDEIGNNKEQNNNDDNKNNNKEKKDVKNFKDIMKFFKQENNNRKNNEINESLLNIKKEKICTIYHFGKIKGLNLSEKIQKIYEKEFPNNELSLKIDFTKYIPEDKCEPHDKSCISINLKTQKIIFVDNANTLKEYLKYFKNSKYIGIDSEWSSSSFNVNNIETASILQLSNYCERTILIIDLLKMKDDKELFDLFKLHFKDKIFIGYAFNKSDIDQFFEELQNMFKDVEIIDLIDLYQNRYLEKAPALKIMCEKLLGKKMCKYEQCSYWENRPLKKSQLHYAAFDAIVCVSLYKILSVYKD